MTLLEVRNVYTAILPDDTFHYEATTKAEKYIVWAEDGQGDASHADNRMQDQAIEGTTDYFTKVEFDPLFDEIQKAMNNAHMSWRLNSIQYEEKTEYIHYEWIWQVVNSIGQNGN